MDNIQREKVINVLRQQGMEISVEQANIIIDYLHRLAAIFVSQYLKNVDSNSVIGDVQGKVYKKDIPLPQSCYQDQYF